MSLSLVALSFVQVAEAAPKLYLNITIDQLRTDFLHEFSNLYGEGGFKRLMSGGKVYENSYFAFENIDRATAMATLTTGTNPYVHGIVGEKWLDRKTLRLVNCVEDKNCKGHSSFDNFSPARLKAITLADEMKRSSRGNAIVCSIAPDGDAAVLAGGHAADVVLWKNNMAGYWCSSTYYGVYPDCGDVMNNNIKGRPSVWKPLLDVDEYNNFGEKPETFSYSFNGKDKVALYKTTANMNDEINEMVLTYLDGSEMGKDNITDFLALTYYAGNYDGAPMEDRPLEIQDTYVRLDRCIASLLNELDKRFGLENVVVSIASTGYVLENGATGNLYRLPSGTIFADRIQALLNMYLGAIFGQADYVEGAYGTQLYFDNKLIEKKKLDKLDVVSRSIEFLKTVDGIEDVFTIYSLGGALSDEMQQVKNGYNPVGSGDIWMRLLPGWRISESEFITDKEVYRTPVMFPIIIYGGGVEHKVVDEMTPANVLVAEMARILRIRRPNDNVLRIY
jgi:hypothetical protein